MESVLQFQYGGLTVMCLAVGVFFLRYWHQQRDRFFLWFMAAFWSFAVSWGVRGVHLVDILPDDGSDRRSLQCVWSWCTSGACSCE